MTLSVSVLIVTFNNEDHIDDCLTSVLNALKSLPAEVIVRDNGSSDGTVSRVRAFDGVRLIDGGDNIGFAAACNDLATNAIGDRLFFVNPDTRTFENAVTELLSFVEDHPEAGLYGARTVGSDGLPLTGSAQGAMTTWSLFCFATGLSTALPHQRWAAPENLLAWSPASTRTVPMLSGGALMVTRAAWEDLGGFDDRFFMYGEDADLCLRAWGRGYQPTYVSTATVEHSGGGSSSSGTKLVYLHKGKVTFIRKNWTGRRAAMGVLFLRMGVGLRAKWAKLAGLRGHTADSRAAAWAEAWRRRHEWTAGWSEGRHAR